MKSRIEVLKENLSNWENLLNENQSAKEYFSHIVAEIELRIMKLKDAIREVKGEIERLENNEG